MNEYNSNFYEFRIISPCYHEVEVLRFFYTALFYLALPFILIRLFWRGRRNSDYCKRWIERLGFTSFKLDQCIWVHVVSVGETVAAIPLIKALQKQYQAIPIVVTNMTETGAARVKAALGESVLHTFIPYDLPGAVARFLERIRPRVAVIMETELWPNLFAACKKRDIPIVVVNARLSAKSALGYQKIASLTREMLASVHGIAAQGSADAERFIALGLAKDKVTVTGNLKFDLELPDHLAMESAALRKLLGQDRLIWIAASTHAAEEEVVLAAHRLVKQKYPSALLILVPRHPNRFDAVARLCEEQNFVIARRSRGDVCSMQTDIYLGDTMGELLMLYSAADVALVGGSFVQVGGHNMLEPAALHKPILTGPILFNFSDISEMLLSANGMFMVKNADELAIQLQQWFADPELSRKIGENAFQVTKANRGALAKQVALIAVALQNPN